MRRSPAWLKVVAVAHSESAPTWTDQGVTVQRVVGGANNALYRVADGGEHFACKLCVNDERRRAKREFEALRVLKATGLDLAPQPLWLDERCTVVSYPAVAYRWVSGTPLGPELTTQQLAALITSIQQIHGVRPAGVGDKKLVDAWFHWFGFGRYLGELHGFTADLSPWLIESDGQGPELCARLNRLVESCVQLAQRSDADPRREHVPLRFCRVDPGLANALWCVDGRLRWVDWEYSGWGDPALELADLRWHAALDRLTSTEHDWLRDSYRRPADDTGFEKRLAVWDLLIATRWACLTLRWLWSTGNGPDRERLTQPPVNAAALRAQFLRFIERAEHVATTAHYGR